MLTTFLNQVSKYFSERFVVKSLFPSFAFVGANLAMAIWLLGPMSVLSAWSSLALESQIFFGILFVVVLVMLGFFLESCTQPLTHLFEGYWRNIWGLRRICQTRRDFHLACFDKLKEQQKHINEALTHIEIDSKSLKSHDLSVREKKRRDELRAYERDLKYKAFYLYPDDRSFILPTRLGNILRAAELYPMRRYGIDSVILWPRLVPSLPSDYADKLYHRQSSLNLLINLATLAAGFAILWSLVILVQFPYAWLPFLTANAGWLVAWLAYRSSLSVAILLGQLIRTAYDLYRWDLLESLHIQKPGTREEERSLWQQVTDLIYRGYPPHPAVFRYKSSAGTPTKGMGSALEKSVSGIYRRLKDALQAVLATLSQTFPGGLLLRAYSDPPAPRELDCQMPPDRHMQLVASVLSGFVSIIGLLLLLNAHCRLPTVPVAVESLPPYHQITIADLSRTQIPRSSISGDAIRNTQQIVGKYTVGPIEPGTPIIDSMLGPTVEERLISDTVPLALKLGTTATFGGKLSRGQVVELWDTDQRLLSDVLILDVQCLDSDTWLVVFAIRSQLYSDVVSRSEPNWGVVPERR